MKNESALLSALISSHLFIFYANFEFYWFSWFLKLRVNVKSCFGRFGTFRDIQDITGNDPGDILETSIFWDFDSYFSWVLTNLKWWIWWAEMHRIWWNLCEVSQNYIKIQESKRTNSNNGQIFHNVWITDQMFIIFLAFWIWSVRHMPADCACEYIPLWAEDLLKSYSQRKKTIKYQLESESALLSALVSSYLFIFCANFEFFWFSWILRFRVMSKAGFGRFWKVLDTWEMIGNDQDENSEI